MNAARRLALSMLASALCACTAVGVPATPDPWEKFLQGCALLDAGRVFPAYPLLRDSVRHYESTGERLELAMAQMQYARLIESPTFVVNGQFADRREALGGRAALPMRARELNERARENVVAELGVAATAPERRTQLNLVLAEAQRVLGEREQSCAALAAAAKSFESATDSRYRYAIYRYKTVPEYVEARRAQSACP